jgi:hypothetical protein
MPISVAVFLFAALPVGADDPPRPASPPAAAPAPPAAVSAPTPAGQAFRLAFQHFGVEKQPIGAGELIASRGKVYYVEKNSKEVVVVDPAARALHLIDLSLKVAADLPYAELEAEVVSNRAEHRRIADEHARSRLRGERVDGEIRRDLADPHFQAQFDEGSRTLTLANRSARVEARGEPDDDAARLALLGEALGAVAKLRAFRDPDDLRHLVEVDAIAALVVGRKLRPAETTYLFRLTGPPEKYRWTFLLIPEINADTREALDLIDDQLAKARRVPVGRYDRRVDPDELKKPK